MSKVDYSIPYRIHRYSGLDGYDYYLIKYDGDGDRLDIAADVITSVCNIKTPVAPKAMRDLQARLNSRYVLDRMGIV